MRSVQPVSTPSPWAGVRVGTAGASTLAPDNRAGVDQITHLPEKATLLWGVFVFHFQSNKQTAPDCSRRKSFLPAVRRNQFSQISLTFSVCVQKWKSGEGKSRKVTWESIEEERKVYLWHTEATWQQFLLNARSSKWFGLIGLTVSRLLCPGYFSAPPRCPIWGRTRTPAPAIPGTVATVRRAGQWLLDLLVTERAPGRWQRRLREGPWRSTCDWRLAWPMTGAPYGRGVEGRGTNRKPWVAIKRMNHLQPVVGIE